MFGHSFYPLVLHKKGTEQRRMSEIPQMMLFWNSMLERQNGPSVPSMKMVNKERKFQLIL